MDLEAKKAVVQRMRRSLGVTEVFCTRILKGNNGSVLVGLTATLDKDTNMEEARVATLLLGNEVEQLAYDRAASSSVISEKQHRFMSAKTRANYNMLLDQAVVRVEPPEADRDTDEGSVRLLASDGREARG